MSASLVGSEMCIRDRLALTTHCGPWAYMPPLVRVSGFPDAQETLAKALSKAATCIESTQYTFDARCLAAELTAAARRGVSARLLVDRAKCRDSPGQRQVEQLELLLQRGVEVRMPTP
eukprot:14297773-Alexandrium_andersonii.AAC.1